MKTIWLIRLFYFLPFLSGCSYLVCGSGFNLRDLNDRNEVAAKFGPPTLTGQYQGESQEANSYDEVTTRRKLYHLPTLFPHPLTPVVTLGLSEIVCLPLELYIAAKDSIQGQKIRFIYDADGKLVRILVNDVDYW